MFDLGLAITQEICWPFYTIVMHCDIQGVIFSYTAKDRGVAYVCRGEYCTKGGERSFLKPSNVY